MPWTETLPMQCLDFIRASLTGTESFSALCRRFGISRKTGYKWHERFDPAGEWLCRDEGVNGHRP